MVTQGVDVTIACTDPLLSRGSALASPMLTTALPGGGASRRRCLTTPRELSKAGITAQSEGHLVRLAGKYQSRSELAYLGLESENGARYVTPCQTNRK